MLNPVKPRLDKKPALIPSGLIKLAAEGLSEVIWLVSRVRLERVLSYPKTPKPCI